LVRAFTLKNAVTIKIPHNIYPENLAFMIIILTFGCIGLIYW
jgi:hypothetical protein